jgi:hypothetical protein
VNTDPGGGRTKGDAVQDLIAARANLATTTIEAAWDLDMPRSGQIKFRVHRLVSLTASLDPHFIGMKSKKPALTRLLFQITERTRDTDGLSHFRENSSH